MTPGEFEKLKRGDVVAELEEVATELVRKAK